MYTVGMPKKGFWSPAKHTIIWPLLVSSGLSVSLYICRMLGGQSTRYWFLIWNLFLAWLPLLFAFWLKNYLKENGWFNWKAGILTLLWLGFLPNSFYLVTDFIHLKNTGEVSLLYDAVMFMSYAWNGLILGFVSVFLVHGELLKRLRPSLVSKLILGIFILCSFAIYLGRYLAWNTWDIVINPFGIIFDVGNRIVKPASYPNTFTTTSLFAVVLIAMYYSIYKLIAAIRHSDSLKDI